MKEKAFEVLNIFYDNGYEAYIVGGFVRDSIIGRKSYDIDIATNATPKEVMELFNNVKIPYEDYGSVRLTYKKVNFEITTYRMEIEYTNKRKPSKIIYTDKLEIDLKRRDFTVNTLCMDKEGNIIDLLDGKIDIENRVLKTVGNADKKLKEDALRILRAIRFAAELKFEISSDLEDAIIKNKEGLKELSFYRKKQELQRIFSFNNSHLGIALLRKYELDKYLDINLDKYIVITNDPIGIWAQVEPSSNYPFTSNETEYLKAILRVLKDENITDMELYREGNYVCYIACQILKQKEEKIYERYDNLPIKKASDIVLNGKDIIDILNLEDKSVVKDILKDIEQKIVNKVLKNDVNELTNYIIDTYQNNVL